MVSNRRIALGERGKGNLFIRVVSADNFIRLDEFELICEMWPILNEDIESTRKLLRLLAAKQRIESN